MINLLYFKHLQVFQPLLMQHFTYEELKQIKATVLQQHFKMETEDIPEKFVADNKSSKLFLRMSVEIYYSKIMNDFNISYN
jgi:hypothetical protein